LGRPANDLDAYSGSWGSDHTLAIILPNYCLGQLFVSYQYCSADQMAEFAPHLDRDELLPVLDSRIYPAREDALLFRPKESTRFIRQQRRGPAVIGVTSKLVLEERLSTDIEIILTNLGDDGLSAIKRQAI
jgi:hypothetical protein